MLPGVLLLDCGDTLSYMCVSKDHTHTGLQLHNIKQLSPPAFKHHNTRFLVFFAGRNEPQMGFDLAHEIDNVS